MSFAEKPLNALVCSNIVVPPGALIFTVGLIPYSGETVGLARSHRARRGGLAAGRAALAAGGLVWPPEGWSGRRARRLAAGYADLRVRCGAGPLGGNRGIQ